MNNNRSLFRSSMMYIMMFVAIVIVVSLFNQSAGSRIATISYSQFVEQVKNGEVSMITIQQSGDTYTIAGEYKEEKEIKVEGNPTLDFLGGGTVKTKKFETVALVETASNITDLAIASGTTIKNLQKDQTGAWVLTLLQMVPIILLGFLAYTFIAGQMGQNGGARGVMSFGKAKIEDQSKRRIKVKFSDVAGAEEEKQELVEVVEFLKDPRKFTALGARIPAGVLLEGPPGTGKTLLAKAVAGEAGVPFFSISGSEFVEMFAGVGASRVRDLFEMAKKNAPAIIFIDEIDAVGRQRGIGLSGGHDEREQTLNQLLVELDGFQGNEGVVVIAATNRSDVLDQALLRPGRFDRQVLVSRPDVKGREAILKVHARNKVLTPEVDLKQIAKQTPGFSGAELENLLNEAALVAARRNKTAIDALDIDEAHDRVIAGPAKKDRAVSEKERKMVAFHEAGHTIVGLVLSDARIVHKVTIVPRGRAGGYAIMLPKEDRFLMTKNELFEQVVGLLGGRAAEELIFNEQTTGASNDFEQATAIVRSMITEYGMYDEIGTVQYEGNHRMFVGREYGQTKAYSEQVAFEIDQAVRKVMREAYTKAQEILQSNTEKLTLIAEKLLEFETLDETAIQSLYNDGVMPELTEVEEFPSEAKAASYDEVKEVVEKRDAIESEEVAEHERTAQCDRDVDTNDSQSQQEDEAEPFARSNDDETTG